MDGFLRAFFFRHVTRNAIGTAERGDGQDVTLDGYDLLPLLSSSAKSRHETIFGTPGAELATVRDDRWKLHLLPGKDPFKNLDKPGQRWLDPRGPDGITILAPYEQPQPDEHPGVRTGDNPKAMQLFDLQKDPSEQQDVSGQHPEVIDRFQQAVQKMKQSLLPSAQQ